MLAIISQNGRKMAKKCIKRRKCLTGYCLFQIQKPCTRSFIIFHPFLIHMLIFSPPTVNYIFPHSHHHMHNVGGGPPFFLNPPDSHQGVSGVRPTMPGASQALALVLCYTSPANTHHCIVIPVTPVNHLLA